MQMRQTHRVKSQHGPNGVALNLLASALTILAAIALLGAATVFGDTSATTPVSGRHDGVIHDFYGAVNEALRSGDSTALDRIAAPDLVFYPPSTRIAPNRAGLDRYLTSIHDTFPAFQLRVDAIVSDGDRAVATVTGGSESPGGFLGLTLATAPSTWGQFDSFRIADGQIIEMRSGAAFPVLFEPANEVRLDFETVPQAISFERLSASTGEHREWGPWFGPGALYVDEGAITVDLSSTEPPVLSLTRNAHTPLTPVASSTHEIVSAGEVMSFPASSQSTFRHDAADSGVAAYMVALPRFHYDGPYQPQEPTAINGGVDEPANLKGVQTALDGEQALDPLAGVTVAIGRAHLPSGATIAFQATAGSVFVVAETGAVVLTKELDAQSLDRLDVDGLGLVEPGKPFALHNLGDNTVTVFMATVLPSTTFATPAS